MTKPLIVANWKMNPPTFREAERIFLAVRDGVAKVRGVEVVVCPPFVWLAGLAPKRAGKLLFGAQDVFWEGKGAFTGGTSPAMLKSSGVRYVIVGHSERRRFFGENDEMISKKVKASLGSRLTPIIAVGEELEDSADVVPPAIARELNSALSGVPKKKLGSVVVAYEPVWAVGTGRADTPDNATRRAIYIRKLLTRIAGRRIAEGVRILYGGSVTAKNAASFLSTDIRGMDGLLVGGASLDSGEFIKIVQSVAEQRKRLRY